MLVGLIKANDPSREFGSGSWGVKEEGDGWEYGEQGEKGEQKQE